MPSLFLPLLGATVILAFLSFLGLVVVPERVETLVDMRIEPHTAIIEPDHTFIAKIVVSSPFPVNVFSGELSFNPQVLEVESIEYNTSIADLWAEKPWFENGAGTLNFIGGTTRQGGFIGVGELITIHFKAKQEGAGTLAIKDAHVLMHDGLGTFALMKEPIDAVFSVAPSAQDKNLIIESAIGTHYTVIQKPPSTDLNGDGTHSIADISIFMLHLVGDDPRYDFNQDGRVNLKDLGIIMSAK